MNETLISLAKLRGMIGLRLRYQDAHWEIVEILEGEPSLVLEHLGNDRVVQTSQFGEARRRVRRRLTVPVLDEERDALHPEFLSLGLPKES